MNGRLSSNIKTKKSKALKSLTKPSSN